MNIQGEHVNKLSKFQCFSFTLCVCVCLDMKIFKWNKKNKNGLVIF